MKTLREIGVVIAEEREKAGYTQEGLAEKIGCQPNSLSRWENGATTMKIDTFQSIVSALGISADYILGVDTLSVSLDEMVSGLSSENLEIVRNTVAAIVQTMKFQQK
jgi:transcriptional regulator with XRE-family HTH domain